MRDWARVSVERQIKGMKCDRFEIGVRDALTGRMMNHEWSAGEVVAKVQWLKAMNARGNDIYIRPAGGDAADLVLIDDLTPAAVARLKADGLAAAVAVETSPGNYQAWIRIPTTDDTLRAEASRILAGRYGGDIASTGRTHYGRLAGFTNRKPGHADESGRGPFCRLDSYAGAAGPAAADLVAEAEASIAARASAVERERRVAAISNAGDGQDLVSEYRRRAGAVMRKYDEPDLSRVDYMVARDMARAGRSPADIAGAITEASPSVTDRKAGHVDDYATRTTAAAVKAVESERQNSASMGR